VQDFRRLRVWRLGHEFTLAVYAATARFPRSESFALTSQLRRSASSIPSNIAEGCGRGSNADFARSLQTARGSASEADYQLQLAHELNYLDQDVYADLRRRVDELERMLSSLIRTLRLDDDRRSSPRTQSSKLTTQDSQLRTQDS
jgi:four helix bundle protein